MQGLKRKRRCQDQCKDHLFALQCLKPNSLKYDINLLFCPKYQREPQPPEFIHPEFNNDGKYYTSAFILGVDRRVLVKNEQQEIMDHQKQVRDSLEKHNQLVFPRPNSKHSHCSVCKDQYRNYYMHIATEEHRQKIAASPYNYHIKGLCTQYEHLWEGAEERADAEAERRAAEEEQRRQKMAEMTVREQPEEEEEDELLDVQKGDNEEEEQEEEPEEYQAKQTKKNHNRYAYNDDTVPLARACKRTAPTAGRIYQSEYLRKKQLLNSMITAERLQKEREERRYERERDKLKTERDVHGSKDFVKMCEKQGDVFVIMKAAYAVGTNIPQNIATLPVAKTVNNLVNDANPASIAPQAEFVWKRSEKPVKKDDEKSQKTEKPEWPERMQRMEWPDRVERMERGERMERVERMERGERVQRMQNEDSSEIEKENRKYEIHYDELQINKEEMVNEEQYDMRYHYYPYPPPYLPTNNYKQETFKNDHAPKIDPYKNQNAYKTETHSYKYESKANLQGRNDAKPYDPFKNTTHPPPYYNPYPSYPMYDHYPPRDKADYYGKEKQKGIGEKGYDYDPYHWSYPPPHYYMPLQPEHPPKPTSSVSGGSYPGNTNININFPMYMCPPPHPSYSVNAPRYPPYMGYQYPPYLPNQPRDTPPPQPPSNSYPPYQQHASHQYKIENMPSSHQNYQPPATHPPTQTYPPYMHHYPQQYQYPPQQQQYPPQTQKRASKF